jgi:hypothetical protein
MNTKENLLDFLSKRHLLPTFNLPTDAVPFIVRTRDRSSKEKILVNMSTGLEQALTQYGPGKELMVKKEEYVSHGLYLDFPLRPSIDKLNECPTDIEKDKLRLSVALNRFRLWYDEALINQEDEFNEITWLHMCDNQNCRNTIDHTGTRDTISIEDFSIDEKCKFCAIGSYITTPLLRPPGFAPLVSSEKGDHIKPNSESYSHVLSTRWPTQLTDQEMHLPWTDLAEDRFLMNFQKGSSLININGGRESEVAELSGFSFCRDCGYLGTEPTGVKASHERPYAIVSRDNSGIRTTEIKNKFKTQMRSKCGPPEEGMDNRFSISSGGVDYNRLFLGRRFKSDVLIFRINWPSTNELIPFDDNKMLNIARKAATSLAQSMIRSLTEGGVEGISIQTSDIGADVRMFVEDERRGWDIFIYETADGGIGLLEAIHQRILSVYNDGSPINNLPALEMAIDILEGRYCSTDIPDTNGTLHSISNRPCDSICHGCLLDFTTQFMQDRLDREIGADLLRYAIYGLEHLRDSKISRTDSLISLYRLLCREINPEKIQKIPFMENKQSFSGPDSVEFDTEDTLYYEKLIIDDKHNIKICSPLLSMTETGNIEKGLELFATKTELVQEPHRLLKTIKSKLRPPVRKRRSRRGVRQDE